MTSFTIKSLYVNLFKDKLIAYVALRLIRFFNTNEVSANIMGISSYPSINDLRTVNIKNPEGVQVKKKNRTIYRDAIPQFLLNIVYKIFPEKLLFTFTEWRFLRSIQDFDIVYLFPRCSISLYTRLKRKNCTILVERINTLRNNSKKILDNEYRNLGLTPDHGITDSDVFLEIEKLKLADYIFSPSPAVKNSIVSAGIAADKIISSSYGIDPDDILDIKDRSFQKENISVIFVGNISIRKGVHLLLEAWEKAEINGQLSLIGNISTDFAPIFNRHIQNDSIKHVPFVEDLKPYYKQADIFVLPSLEEGSPLVTYLALGAGLPSIVSPMGGGGIINNEQEGLIINPNSIDEIVEALQKLANNPQLRSKMSENAGEAANTYLWEKVAVRRRKQIVDKISSKDN